MIEVRTAYRPSATLPAVIHHKKRPDRRGNGRTATKISSKIQTSTRCKVCKESWTMNRGKVCTGCLDAGLQLEKWSDDA